MERRSSLTASLMVDGANVVGGGAMTGNARLHLIDSVLMPQP